MLRFLVSFVWLMLLSMAVQAESARFVGGKEPVKLRSDVGEKALIIATLVPATPVTELTRSADGAYSRVRLASGKEGWVPARSLLASLPAGAAQPTAQSSLPVALTESAAGPETPDAHIARLTHELTEAQQQLAFLRDAAAKPKQLEQENAKLQQQMVSMQNDMRLLQEKNLLLQDSSGKEGFVIGAIVFFAGLIFGLLIPHLMPRKPSMWKQL